MRTVFHTRVGRPVAGLVLAATLGVAAAAAAGQNDPLPANPAVKAAFLFNFAKFAEWPTLAPKATLSACVVGDEPLEEALVEIVRGKEAAGHPLTVVHPDEAAAWGECHLLFITGARLPEVPAGLRNVAKLPVLTVSDGTGFSRVGGIIEFYLDAGRMRFAINLDAAERSGVRLSSRLLGLATVIRDRDVP